MTKQLARFSAAVMVTLLALVVLWQFRIVVVYVLISLTLAASLRPLNQLLVGKNIVVRVAWILLFLTALGGFGFLLFLAGKTAINEMQLLARTISVQDEWILPIWLKGSSFQLALVGRLPPPSQLFNALIGNQGELVLPAILDITQGIGSVTSGILIILFLSIYWVISQIHFERLWLSLLPSDLRKQARDIWRTVETEIGAYVRNQILRSLIAGLLLCFGYWLLGSPYPVFMALVGALAYLVPVVGAALVIISPLLLGLVISVQLSAVTVLYTLIVLIVLGIWINPRLFNRKWDNPILNVVLLITLTNAFGMIGIIIAPPLSVVCQILWSRLVSHRQVSGAAVQVSDLKERLVRIRDTINAMDEPNPPLITSSMERLTSLFTEAAPILESSLYVEPSQSISEIGS
jgi:putative permease